MSIRRAAMLVSFITLAAIGVTLTTFRTRKSHVPPSLSLPAASEVTQMTARMVESEFVQNELGFPKVPEFVVPNDNVAKILMWLQPNAYAENPMAVPREQIGEVSITDRVGQQVRLKFYWTGHNPTCFTLDGSSYFWGRPVNERGSADFFDGGITLGNAIRNAAASTDQ